MNREMRLESPPILLDFLTHHETIKSHSPKTVEEYFFDLRMLFRFLKIHKRLIDEGTDFSDIAILDIDENFVKRITLSDAYAFLAYLSGERVNLRGKQRDGKGLGATARARKVATIRSFFKYLTLRAHILEINPMLELDSPRLKKTLPRYLTEAESLNLLDNIHGKNPERDYAIITLFLNCGLRISELQGLNVADVQGETIRVLGKGNKERILFLNNACQLAIQSYLEVRPPIENERAMFLTRRQKRISVEMIHVLVKKHIAMAGLDSSQYSSHKLRHTAATLMLGNGVDVRVLQEVLGHEHLNTTQIYTHVENEQLRLAAKANPLAKVKKKNK